MDKEQVRQLAFLCRSYNGLNKLIVATKTRLKAMSPEIDGGKYWMIHGVIENRARTSIRYQGMESIRSQIARNIEKELEFWPLWTEWLMGVPGIGPHIGGELILLYYYRFVPVCKICGGGLIKQNGTFWCDACEKSIKGDGNLEFDAQLRDFRTISAWWAFMGRDIGDDGHMRKRKAGEACNWSTVGRTLTWEIGEQFVRKGPDHLYRQVYDERRRLRDKTHPESSELHKHRMAKNEASKLFLAHLWQVARTLDGKPLTDPYPVAKDPLHKVIPPFYWGGKLGKCEPIGW